MNSIRCPVCCSTLAVLTAGCVRCQTPHHDECFSFMGGCAVFGCGGKAFGTVEISRQSAPITIDGTEAPDAKMPPPMQRGIWQRIGHSWRALGRNALMAATLALTLSGITTLGGLMLGRTPLNANIYETINEQVLHFKPWTPLSETQLKQLLARARKEEAAATTRAAKGDERVQGGTLASAGVDSRAIKRLLGRDVPAEPLGVVGWIGLAILLVHQLGITAMFAAMLMIIGLASRARGKQYTVGELSRIALPRLGRVMKTFFRVIFTMLAPPALMVFLVGFLGSFHKAAWMLMLLVGPASIVWLFYTMTMLMLAHVVAAMGIDDEPGDPIQRSRQIVRLRPWHTFFGFLASMMVIWPLSIPFAFVVNAAGMPYGQTVAMQFGYLALISFCSFSATFFQVFLYFEGRRQLEPEFMPFPSQEASGA